MTHEEVKLLNHFSPNERDYLGKPVNWDEYWGATMVWIDKLRDWVGSPCFLIRGDHNIGSGQPFSADRRTAIDCTFKDRVPYARVMMEVMRLPTSWGVYVGRSIHLDLRVTDKPARWMAFRPQHRPVLESYGLGSLVSKVGSGGWLYLPWSTALGPKALHLLANMADDLEGDILQPVRE